MKARVGLAAVLGVLCLVATTPSASAVGGIYNVVKCHPWHIEADEVEHAGGHPSYWTVNDCRGTATDPKLGVFNAGAAGNTAYEQFMFSAPPGTHIETACLDHRLRRDGHHRAEVLAFPGFQVLAAGGDGPDGWVNQCFDLHHSQVIVRLACSQAGGCPDGPNAHAYVRNIVLAVSDDVDPVITAFGGELLGGGWLRGSKTLVADAGDGGAGAYHLVSYVNGVEVGRESPLCSTGSLGWNFSASFRPCPVDVQALNLLLSTAATPFVNGANTMTAYVADYAGNTDVETRTVIVDNGQPHAAFRGETASDDPELIRANVSDAHSGVAAAQMYYRAVGAESWQPLQTQLAGGQARARVNSSSGAPGEYEFKLTIRDVAGNESETTLREDGAPMRLNFPLRAEVELRTSLGPGGSTGQIVPYGTRSEVHGRLLDARGDPLAGQEIVVVDRFDNGALFPRAERPVVTDEQGRFRTPEPAGPTRSIEATFAGTSRYQPTEDEVGKFAVKGAASFRTSADEIPEGEPITFAGKVKHRGARIPAGGKLVEIQYRVKTGRQRTLKEPFRTEPDGSYRLVYRFSKALTADALFRFRVKVRNEGNWPFKGSTSKWRKVIVRAK